MPRLPFVLLGLLVAAAGALAFAAALARAGYETFTTSCSLETATARPLGRTSFVYAGDDTLLGAVRAPSYRQPMPAERISPWLRRATVAIEDRRFYEHDGLDLRAIARAAVRNLRQGAISEGASTITQQLARNLYLTNAQTFGRKRKEACLALALEREWTKEEILTAYLNRTYYGHRAYGVEAAAQTFFSRRAADLGPAQAATIAGLAQAPSRYDPLRRPEHARARRNDVLRAMHAAGSLSAAELERAVALPLNLRPGDLYTRRREPYFLDEVRRQLVAEYGEETVRRGGLRVYTTVIPRYQRQARDAIRAELGRPGDPAAAAVSIDPRNGAIRTITSVVPGARPDFNLAIQGRRQAGSAFKTFVLLEAMRRGANPYATRYNSAPFVADVAPGQEPWKPKTYDGRFHGPSTLTQATLRSDNVVFAKLTLDVGPASVAALARELGVRTPLDPVASIGLGSNAVSVIDLASAYATLAAGGVYREPYAIRRVVFPDGRIDRGPAWGTKPPRRVLDDAVAYHATRILEQNVLRGTGTAAQIGRPAAGKTGTTDDHTDAWFVGYTPRVATAVWVGYPHRTARMTNVRGIRVTGGSFPARIWGRYHRAALARAPVADWRAPRSSVRWEPWNGNRRYTGPARKAERGDAGDAPAASR